jgi:hypothetical protein
MPFTIPWATGEHETFLAAKEAGQRRLAALATWGDLVGSTFRYGKERRARQEDLETKVEAADEYDRIEGQTADELERQEAERRKAELTGDSAVIKTDKAVQGTENEPDPRTSKGVPSPGTYAQAPVTSKQQDGAKPADPTQQGVTSEDKPPPATKEESTNEEAGVVRGAASRDGGPTRLGRYAENATESTEGGSKNFGTYVAKGTDAVVNAARGVGRSLKSIGGTALGGLAEMFGVEEPERRGQLSRLARFGAQQAVRTEEQKRGASLANVITVSDKPGQTMRQIMPYTFRHMADIEKMAPRQRGVGNPSVLNLLMAANNGNARKAIAQYYKLEDWLARSRGRGTQNWQTMVMEMLAAGGEDAELGTWLLKMSQKYGLSRMAPEDAWERFQRFAEGMGADLPGLGGGGGEEPDPTRPSINRPRGGRGGNRPENPPDFESPQDRQRRREQGSEPGAANAGEPPTFTIRGDAPVTDALQELVDKGTITPEMRDRALAKIPGRETTILNQLPSADQQAVMDSLAGVGEGNQAKPESKQPTAGETPTTTLPPPAPESRGDYREGREPPRTTPTTLPPRQRRPAPKGRGRKPTQQDIKDMKRELQPGATAGRTVGGLLNRLSTTTTTIPSRKPLYPGTARPGM